MDLHLFDFDGTLVDSSHRYRLGKNGRIDLEYWRDNEPKAIHDTPLPLFRFFESLLFDPSQECAIVTARIWDRYSKQWWSKRRLPDVPIVARLSDSDKRSGVELKTAGIARLYHGQLFDSITIYEDNLDYLEGMARFCRGAFPHSKIVEAFIPSNQGH